MENLMLFFLLICSSAVLWWVGKRWQFSLTDLFLGWGIKLMACIAFLMIFTQYYGNGELYGDAYNFIHDSALLHEFAKENPIEYLRLLFGFSDECLVEDHSILRQTQIWSFGSNGDFINDNRLIIRLNSLIHFFSFGNLYFHGIFLSFLSYLGILFLYRAFQKLTVHPRFFFYALILFPSIAFWGSGITKESVLLFGVGLFFYSLHLIRKQISFLPLIGLILSVFILLLNKPHVGLILFSLFLVFLFFKLTMGSTKRTRFVISISVLFAFVGSLFIPSSINSLDKISYKQKDMINIGKGGIFIVTDSAFCSFDYKYIYNFSIDPTEKVRVLRETPGEYKVYGTTEFLPFTIHPSDKKELLYYLQSPSASYIPVTPINYDPINLVKTIPEVVQNVLLRPYPWDPGSPLKWFAILNNLLLLSFMIIGVWKQRKLPERVKMMRHYLLLSIICLLLMIGWTIPILGAIVRYKMIAELFILIIVFISLKPLRYAKK